MFTLNISAAEKSNLGFLYNFVFRGLIGIFRRNLSSQLQGAHFVRDRADLGEQINYRYLFSPEETGKAKKALDL